MKITQSEPKNLVSTISIEIKKEDYNEDVEKILKNYRKTADIPGFRRGKTPMGIISKKYRNGVVADQVNKLIQDKLYNYITSDKIRVLGSPLPIDDKIIAWDKQDDFIFKYEVGLAPTFDLKITQKDKLNYYKIKVDTKIVNNYCKDMAKRYGKMNQVDVSKKGDLVFCVISQLNQDGSIMQNGVSNEATVSMDYIDGEKNQKKFIGVRSGDVININVLKAFKNHHDLSAMLNIKKEEVASLTSHKFKFEVKNISRLIPAELKKELFDQVYGPGIVKDVKGFKSKVKQEIEQQFSAESDKMLKNDVVHYLLNKLKIKMPDDFLKRWLVKTSEQPITMEILDKEYDMYAKSLQWQLIENKIIEQFKIKVNEADVLAHTKVLIAKQMLQYGQQEDDTKLTDIANNILKNDKERKKIYDQIFDARTLELYKQNFKLTDKTVTYDEFVKLASEK